MAKKTSGVKPRYFAQAVKLLERHSDGTVSILINGIPMRISEAKLKEFKYEQAERL